MPEAEQALRQASASPHADARVRQNLALVLALEGKFAEAEQTSRQDMTAQAASANVAAIKQMIAQNDSWRDLQTGAVKPKRGKRLADRRPWSGADPRRGGAGRAACARRSRKARSLGQAGVALRPADRPDL